MELDPPQLPQAPPAPPYFYDHYESPGDDFHRSSAPSEDIWKKFELLPSPPASPLAPGPAEDAAADYLLEPGRLLGNLSAFVLRDCMWSGFSARERLEKAMGEKLTAKPPAQGPPAAAAPIAAQAPHDAALGGQCVAPGAVFTWPADCKLPASSGSESQSESEGEEIDVVTVEKRQSLGVRKPVTITVRADPLDPCMKRFHISIHQQQHNYAARSPPEACSCTAALEKSSQEEEEDEEDEEDGAQSLRQVAEPSSLEPCLLKSGSAPSSDSEDVTKRKNHNYLERKRRNDLRSRFLALRDQVPGLATCPKTPKVVVLSKASEYLQSLLKAEQQMVAEKKLLKLHQLQLLKRISYLKSAH
nr:protein L-Myc [Zootoca vivipara]